MLPITLKRTVLAVSLSVLMACNSSTSSTPTETPTTAEASSRDQAFLEQLPASLQQVVLDGRYQASDFHQVINMSGLSISPDHQSIWVNADTTKVVNPYQIALATGEVTSVAPSLFTTRHLAWLSGGERALISIDKLNNGQFELWLRSPEGTLTPLSQAPHNRQAFVGVSEDHASLFVTSNHRDPRAVDVYRVDAATLEFELLYQNDQRGRLTEVSPDGRYGMFVETKGNIESSVSVVDFLNPDVAPISLIHSETVGSQRGFGFTDDSQYALLTTDQFGEEQRGYRVSLSSGEVEALPAPEGEVNDIYYSAGDRYRTMVVDQGAYKTYATWDSLNEEWLDIPDFPDEEAREVSFSSDGNLVAFYRNTSESPSELHVWDRATETVTQLTQNLNQAVASEHLVEAKVVRYASFDGQEIEGILYRPHSENPETQQAPVVLHIHGGPRFHESLSFDAEMQYLVSQGFGVFAVNYRGGTGYGKQFERLNDRRHGQDDVADLLYAKRYLETLDWVDSDKVGLIGHSYGGYLVSTTLMTYPDEFQLGVSLSGISNWIRTLEGFAMLPEGMRNDMYQEHGDPSVESERARLHAFSPVFHTDKITKPMLIMHGAMDFLVPKIESDDLVQGLRTHQVPVEYMVFEGEGHVLNQRDNQILHNEAQVRFLAKHLKD